MDGDSGSCFLEVVTHRASLGAQMTRVIILEGSESDHYNLKEQFVTKDMEKPKYFLRIEIVHSKHRVILSQRKYALDLLEETGFLGCKLVSTLMDTNSDFWYEYEGFKDTAQCRRLVGKSFILLLQGHILPLL